MGDFPAQQVTSSDVTVAIPVHPARIRNGMLQRAVDSVWAQTRLPDQLSIAVDVRGDGAAKTRQRALDAVNTRWVAFLDSDDKLLPQHLQALTEVAERLDAVFVYSWFEPVGFGADPLGHFGKPFDPRNPHHTTMTVLVDTKLAQEVGFIAPEPGSTCGNEDWQFILGICKLAVERGLLMTHLAERTWQYHYHGNNTSGMPHQGDAQ